MLGSLWEFPRARLRLQTVIIIISNHPHLLLLIINLFGSPLLFKYPLTKCVQVLGEGNFGKVWKAEVDDICGYEGTILVAVKGVKASVSSLFAFSPPFLKCEKMILPVFDPNCALCCLCLLITRFSARTRNAREKKQMRLRLQIALISMLSFVFLLALKQPYNCHYGIRRTFKAD